MHACAMYSAAQDERAPHWNTKNGTAKPQMHFQNWKILRARQPPSLPHKDATHAIAFIGSMMYASSMYVCRMPVRPVRPA
jgi:hypothetical protein